MTTSYRKVLTIDLYPEDTDAFFKVEVSTEYESGYVWELDPMRDAQNRFCHETGRQMITVVATDTYHNVYKDYEPYSVILEDQLARDVVKAILEDKQDSLWFTKDRLSFAERYGKVI